MSSVVVFHYSPTTRALAACALREAGYTVYESADAREAWLLTKAMRPGAVLTDFPAFLNPPPANGGVTLAEAILADDDLVGTPIISLTTDDEPAMLKYARAAGVSCCMALPVEPRRIVAQVSRILARRRGETQSRRA